MLRHDAGARSYCTLSSTGAVGSCSDTAEGCQRARAIQIDVRQQMTECFEQVDVTCFGYRSTNGAGHVACAPTARTCETIRAGLENRTGIASVQECAEMPLGQREQPAAGQ